MTASVRPSDSHETEHPQNPARSEEETRRQERAVPRPFPGSIAFWTPRRGVLAASASLLTTADGGRTWQRRHEADDDLGWVTVAGSRDAWALEECCSRKLWHSADGGRTWQLLGRTAAMEPLFATRSLGFALDGRNDEEGISGWGEELLRTKDGGRTWRAIPNPCRRAGMLASGVSFASSDRGVVVCSGEGGTGQMPKAVLITRDGGRHWRMPVLLSVGAPERGAGLSWGGYPETLALLKDGTAWLLQGYTSTLHPSSDWGRTWSTADGPPGGWYIRSGWFLSSERAYVLADAGTGLGLARTSDGAASWTIVHNWPWS
jgi:photosystem II stability/assembly factor-like uncharacterized protein